MADEWFRSPTWDAGAAADFEARLRRARTHNRSQYLRIKGLALRDGGRDDDAMRLFQRVIDEYPESLDARSAHEHLGDGFHQAARLDDAEREFRTVLATNPSLNATSGQANLALADVLLDRRDVELAGEIASLLEDAKPHLAFDADVFRWYVLSARLGALMGDRDARRTAARHALELVDAPPQLPRHPTVGLARPSDAILREVEDMARE